MTTSSNIEAFMQADIAFHGIVARASGNPPLEAIIEALSSRTLHGRVLRAIRHQGALAASHREHLAILSALERHDPDSARLRMAAHLLGVEDFLREHPLIGREPGRTTIEELVNDAASSREVPEPSPAPGEAPADPR